MRIERKAITDEILPTIYLLKPQNERFLKWEKFVFWDAADKLQDDFSARLPLSILFILLVLATSLWFAFSYLRYQRFATEGMSAEEELVKKDSSSLDTSTMYYLSYRYSYGDVQYTITIPSNRSEYENAVIGSQRTVLVLPSNRDFIIGNINEVLLPMIFALLLFGTSLVISTYYFYRWYRKVRLIPATLTAVEQGEKHSNLGVHAIFELVYEFKSPKTKRMLKGKISIPAQKPEPQVGQSIAVIYLDDKDFIPL